jgi:hypothetical protein
MYIQRYQLVYIVLDSSLMLALLQGLPGPTQHLPVKQQSLSPRLIPMFNPWCTQQDRMHHLSNHFDKPRRNVPQSLIQQTVFDTPYTFVVSPVSSKSQEIAFHI